MRNCRGFSLIELLGGLALFTLIIGIGINFPLRQYQKIVIKQQISLFLAVWHQQRQQAMATGMMRVMRLNEGENSYIIEGKEYFLPSQVRFGVIPEVKGPPSSPTHPLHSAITFIGNKVTFYPDGTVQAGTVYLTDDTRSCLYALTSGASSVSFFHKYRYDGSWHKY